MSDSTFNLIATTKDESEDLDVCFEKFTREDRAMLESIFPYDMRDIGDYICTGYYSGMADPMYAFQCVGLNSFDTINDIDALFYAVKACADHLTDDQITDLADMQDFMRELERTSELMYRHVALRLGVIAID
jgi:hypothetical protein